MEEAEAKRLLDDLFEVLRCSDSIDSKKARLMGALGLSNGGPGSPADQAILGGTSTPRVSQEDKRGRWRSPSKQG